MKQTTLGIMIKDWKIFLWEKKRWFAKWVLNWVWGKLEWNESLEECMIRETKEEIWINIKHMEKAWIMHFYFEEKPELNLDVYLYNIIDFDWNIIETEEIKPFWFNLNKIPYDKMWEFDSIWLPRILKWEKNIEYKVWYNYDLWKVLKYIEIS